MVKYQTHIDGVWKTTDYIYKGRKIIVKSAKGKGMKAHAFKPDGIKTEFTLRFSFINPETLLKKVQDKIDKL